MLDKRLTMMRPSAPEQVEVADSFWAPKLESNRSVTLPAIYRQCKESGRIDAWKLDWQPGKSEEPHIFWDSDAAKWIEAVAWSLFTHPDPALEKLADEVIEMIAAAQHDNGYLNIYFSAVKPELRWTNLRDWHELYCAGHLIEAAVAYQQATGKTKLLDVMCRYADLIDSIFGDAPDKKPGFPGHEEIELALVKLYHTTNEERYLRLAKFFVDARGAHGEGEHFFDSEARERGEDPGDYWAKTHAYTQSHIPVRDQSEPVGHAVRGTYLYCAMADLAVEYNDQALLDACSRIWQHLITKRMYLTGGIGASRANEGHTSDYDLPNESAYAETCAAIGLALWSHRMLLIEKKRKYADILERTLYNGILSGVSLAGDTFFYDNPLASDGQHHRWQWHHCVCCPPNLARLIASFKRFIYSIDDDEIFVHLFVSGSARFEIDGHPVTIIQKTDYPWNGKVSIEIVNPHEIDLMLSLRIPGWCRKPVVKWKDENIYHKQSLNEGYLSIYGTFVRDHSVELEFPMPIERIHAHPHVLANHGRVALQRGPLVYCLEEVDNGKEVQDIVLPRKPDLEARFEQDLLGGVVTITGPAKRIVTKNWKARLYSHKRTKYKSCELKAIPYYAWDNRSSGEMTVWIREA